MNNEINQNEQLQNVNVIQSNVIPPVQPVIQKQTQPQVGQQTLDQVIQNNQKPTIPPVDFNRLSPLEKQQLIDRAIKEAELKCKIEKPKPWNGLIFLSVLMVILCITCIIILNIIN